MSLNSLTKNTFQIISSHKLTAYFIMGERATQEINFKLVVLDGDWRCIYVFFLGMFCTSFLLPTSHEVGRL